MVNLVAPEGRVVAVPAEQVQAHLDVGFRPESGAGAAQRVVGDVREERYGGALGKGAATLLGIARTATVGGTDVIANLTGDADAVAAYREVNPGASLVGEIAGAFVPVGAGAAAGRLGARIAKTGEGAGAVTRAVRAGAGYGAEGAIMGAGQGVSELALSDDPLSIERVASVMSSNVLFGGATGGAVGMGGSAVGSVLRKAKGALDDFASKTGSVSDDLADLDVKQLRTAREAEVDSLVAAQTQQKAALVDDLGAYRNTVKDANPWLVVTEGEASSLLTQSSKQLRNAMNDPVGLGKNPASVLKALRVQENALTKALGETDEITKRLTSQNKKLAKELGEELATLPDNLDEVVLTGKHARRYGAWADVKVPKAGEVRINRQKATEFLDALDGGAVAGSEAAALNRLPEVLDANRALQQRIEAATVSKADLVSDRLKQIDDAKDALSAGGKKGMGEQMAGGAAYSTAASLTSAVPIIGPFLAPFAGAKAAQIVGDGLGKAAKQQAQRMADGIGKFLSVGGKVAPAAPVLATKVLSAVAFGTEKPAGKSLPALYKARSAEVRAQVTMTPTGPQMSPAARQKMAAQLAPVRAANPLIADRIETQAAARLAFIASKLPKRPEVGGLPMGPDRWQPSELEMRTWARYVAAAEDPGGVMDRLAAGRVTPEDAETMRTLYPEMLAELTQNLLEQLPTLKKTLPYERRLALSILTGVPVDPAMNPRILRVLQASFAAEPGTEGGTQAPMPQAQFGSVKNQEATPSQQRQQGIA